MKGKLMKEGKCCRNSSKDVPTDCLEKGNIFVHGITSQKVATFMISAVGNISQNSVSRTKQNAIHFHLLLQL
jgi:hypothetical protein